MITSRNANANDEDLARGAKKIEDLDESLAKVYTNLNELKIFILDSNLANKFEMAVEEDYVFLNNLFINEKHIKSREIEFFVS